MRQGPVLFDRDNLAAQIRGDGDVVLLRARHSDRDLAGIGLRLHRDRSRCEGQVDLACVRRSPRRSRPSPVPTIRTAAVFSVSLVSGPITELPPGAPPMSTATRAGVEPTNRKQMVATQHDSRTESHTRRVRRNAPLPRPRPFAAKGPLLHRHASWQGRPEADVGARIAVTRHATAAAQSARRHAFDVLATPARTRRGSSTTGTAGSGGSPPASPPTPPGDRAR